MNKPTSFPPIYAQFNWESIDTVLLDMDGTLLDKYFDDYFWEEYVPQIFAEKHQLTTEIAQKVLLEKYQSVENTLQWTDLVYWTDRLGVDIVQLKTEISHLIRIHDHVLEFLQFIKTLGKNLYLVTNAHSKTLKIKLDRTNIDPFFDRIICSEEIGEAKEQVEFWHKLRKTLVFDKEKTLFADDTEKVLKSAKQYGIKHLIHIAKPSSRLPVQFSNEFPSIKNFGELIGQR